MRLNIITEITRFNELWEDSFSHITPDEMSYIVGNNIFIDNEPIKNLNVEVNEREEFDFYHKKLGDMRYTMLLTISPKENQVIQKHFYPNTNRGGKYAQFLYNTKKVCDVSGISNIIFHVPNKKICEDLNRIGAKRCEEHYSIWKYAFENNDEMELYFDRKGVKRLKEYEKQDLLMKMMMQSDASTAALD